MSTTVNLPQTVDQLRAAIKTAIAYYQESPVRNENKLNEALAASLNMKNYDTLSAVLKASESESETIDTYPIEFDYENEQYLIINGVRMEAELAHEGIVSCTVYDREDRLGEIQIYLGEAIRADRSNDVASMQADIDYLRSSEDEWVLGYFDVNEFIAADVEPKLFNDTCDEMIEAAAEYYREKVGPLTKTGRKYTECTAYYSGEPVSEIFAGELVLIKEEFLGDDKLAIGMCVEKFNGTVPEGYMAAYAGSFGEYVPIYLGDDEDSDDN